MKKAEVYRLEMPINNTQHHLQRLIKEIPWDFPMMYGRKSKRGVCSMGIPYAYSGILVQSVAWDSAVFNLMSKINLLLATDFNAALLNYYPAGMHVGIGAHQDNEPELVSNPVVVSVSLGATVQFIVEGCGEREEFTLEDGDVFVMGTKCQQYYKHSIPATTMKTPRVSLTFRQFRT